MREFKFRAWNKRDLKMEHLDYLNLSKAQFAGNWDTVPPGDLFDVATVKGNMLFFDDVVLLQYSGMKDKDGVEIYEGDILYCVEENYKGAVVFKGGAFKTDAYGFGEDYISDPEKFQVVGNIYENGDLL